MHIGKKNLDHDYRMNGVVLDVVEAEKDLGVVISCDLKSSNQCLKAYASANKILGMINRTIVNKNSDIMLKLYKSLVRPNMEYCTAVWSPYYVKDKELIEKIQHRFTKMIIEVKHLSYADRLRKLDLWSLEERRNRSDLIEVYKMLHGLTSISHEKFFEIAIDKRTRGHSMTLIKHRFETKIRQQFFSERVVNRWNSLDNDTVTASSLNSFKTRLNKLRYIKMGFFLD